jgi:hypothetical protein
MFFKGGLQMVNMFLANILDTKIIDNHRECIGHASKVPIALVIAVLVQSLL